ncbi:MAG: hypothetical protein JXR07_20475 [Reichenbachiella sp.]
MEANIRTLDIFQKWVSTTEEVFRSELSKRGIGITDQLLRSLKSSVTVMAEGYVKGEFQFLTRGRFVDMGAGRGRPTNQRGSKAKRWYSPALYGRLNDLDGIIGYTIMEMAINTIVEPLRET